MHCKAISGYLVSSLIVISLASSALSPVASAATPNAPGGLAPPTSLADACGQIARLCEVPSVVQVEGPSRVPATRGIEVYPNWPCSAAGSNTRGGVFAELDGDADLEILYPAGNRVHAWNVDGTPVPGWPRSLSGYHDGAPAVGDVDGDGDEEIVVSTRIGAGNTGVLHVFERDGSPTPPFPISMHGGATKTPALGDIDGDDALEIIVEERAYPTGYVCAYNGDGTVCPGWPQQLDYVPGSAASVGDITGDGVPEIVGQSYYYVYAWDALGNLLPGFPFAPGANRVFSYSSCVLADLDEDGHREIICGDHSISAGNGRVHVLRNDGSPLPGWPRATSYWIYGPPSVGDIDGDGRPDVAVGDQVLSGSPADYLYAWDPGGSSLPGFPVGPIWAINTQVLLVDLDGDDQVELMTDDNTSYDRYLAYNHDGTPVDGWPLPVQGTSFFINPFAVDINGDGQLDLSGGGYESDPQTSYFFLWNANAPVNAAKNFLAILQYGPQHDGVYRGVDPAAVSSRDPQASGVRLLVGPNPFSRATRLRLEGLLAGPTQWSIYACDGRLVRSVCAPPGEQGFTWDGRDARGCPAEAGVYLCVARSGAIGARQAVVLAR